MREAEYPYYGANGIQDYVSDYIFDGTFILVVREEVFKPNTERHETIKNEVTELTEENVIGYVLQRSLYAGLSRFKGHI